MAIDFNSEDTVVEGRFLSGEIITLEYIPVNVAYNMRWSENPKEGDIGGLIESIEDSGFRDPPEYDATLGAFVSGYHRITALYQMQKNNPNKVPRGVALHSTEGYWCMPAIFGVDASSRDAAVKYAIDTNMLTMAGGNFNHFDLQKMWDKNKFQEILGQLQKSRKMPVNINDEDFAALKKSYDESLDQYSLSSSDAESIESASSAGYNKDSDSGSSKKKRADSTPDNSVRDTYEQDELGGGWVTLSVKLPPHLYDMYNDITREFGITDSERVQGLIRNYKILSNTVNKR